MDELQEWNGWNSKSREYLNKLGKEVAITQVAEEYRVVIIDFYTWLQKRQEELHSQAIKEARAIEIQLSQITREWEEAWGMSSSDEGGSN